MCLRRRLYDAREIRRQGGRGLISSVFGQRRVPGEVEERNRGRLPLLRRRDSSFLHEAFRDADDVLEHGVLPVPRLEPRHEGSDELGVPGRLLVDDGVPLLVRELEVPDPLADREIEKLETGRDQPCTLPP